MTRPSPDERAALEPAAGTRQPGPPSEDVTVEPAADGEERALFEYFAICPHKPGGDGLPCFVTDNHPDQETADKRMVEHLAEHRTGVAMPEIAESAATLGVKIDAETRKHAAAAVKEIEQTGRVTVLPPAEEA